MLQVFFLDDEYDNRMESQGSSPEGLRLEAYRIERRDRSLTVEEKNIIEVTIQSTLAGVLFFHKEQEPIEIAVTQDLFHGEAVKGIPLVGSSFILNVDPSAFRKAQKEVLQYIPSVCLKTLFGSGGLMPLNVEIIQTACKPGSVPAEAGDGHSSTMRIAPHL